MAVRYSCLLLWIMCPLIVHLADVEPELKNLRDSGWLPYGQREFKFFNIQKTWEEAEEDCMQYEAHLASVHDENENHFIKRLIKSRTGQDSPTWLGGYNSPAVPSRWYWTDDSPFDYSQWAPGQPDGSGNCLQINYKDRCTDPTGGWDDLDCTGNLPFVCVRKIKKGADAAVRSEAQFQSTLDVKPELKNLRDSGWLPYGQREFKFFNIRNTWEEAEEDCMQYEAHLASVHDENENRFIKRLIKSQTGQDSLTWLGGYNSPVVPSRWYWTDDSPFDYSQWAPGEPYGIGHCMQINYKGGWDDLHCNGNLPFVCARGIKKGADAAVRSDAQFQSTLDVEPELKNLRDSGWKPYGQREFKFFSIQKTWEEAEEDCIQYEAHLASVHDGNENHFIKRLIKSQIGQDSPTWIGGYNSPAVPSRWYWTDDSPFDYSQWAPGEPDGSGHCPVIDLNGGWDDLDCSRPLPFVCARGIKKGGV